MTPLKRRKMIRRGVILVIVMAIGLFGRYLFRDQSIASLLFGRKPGSAAPGTPLLIPDPKAPPLSTAQKNDPPPEAGAPIRITFKTIGNWKYVERKTPIPPSIVQLDGKWVEISGFMIANNQTDATPRFNLIQSLWDCCFGQTPDINHVIDVSVKPGNVALFYPEPVKVTGKFSVGEQREEGHLVSLYRLEAHQIVVK
jgi:hypothetical protein